MSFLEKVAGIKYAIERGRSAFPISRVNNGEMVNRIDTLVCSLRYQHEWKYSQDGLSFQGREKIFSETLGNNREAWILRYFGKIIVPDLDRIMANQVYQFRDHSVAFKLPAVYTKDSILKGPRMFNDPDGELIHDEDEGFELKFEVNGWAGNFSGSDGVLVKGREVFNLNFEGGFESNLPEQPPWAAPAKQV